MGAGASAASKYTGKFSEQLQKQLAEREEKCKADGLSTEEIEKLFEESKGGLIVYNQIDVDHSGSVTKKELQRVIKSLPRNKPLPPEGGWPDGEEPKFVPFEGLVSTLDSDSDGQISLTEWLENLSKLPGLKAAIEQNIDSNTGKIKGYRSLEEQLSKREGEVAELKKKKEAGEEIDTKKLEEMEEDVSKLRAKVGFVGVTVFNQLDIDKSGKIDRKELLRVLKILPKPENVEGVKKMSIDDIIALFDSDSDGLIDMDEWLFNLYKPELKGLQASLEQALDSATGKIKGYRSLPEQLAKIQWNIQELEKELAQRKEQEKKLLEMGVEPDPNWKPEDA